MPSSQLAISYPLLVLNPIPIRGKGRPRGALGLRGRVAPANTRRELSAFELPSSTAPPTFNRSSERIFVVNSGLTRLRDGHCDLYEAGTQHERSYMRGLSSLYQFDSTVDPSIVVAGLIEGGVINNIEVEDN
jgi:hypothetical protein